MRSCFLNRKGAGIPDNLVAFLLFSVAFIYIVSAMSGYIAPYLEREEYGSVSMAGYVALEKIISDPSYNIVERDHVLDYDHLVEFRADPDAYEELKDALNLKNDFVIEIASTFTTVETLGTVDADDVALSNPNRIILPEGPLPDEHKYDISDGIHYNLERLTIGNESYEILVVPHIYEGGIIEDEDHKKYYDRIYIDVNKNRNFQDEVSQGFYGTGKSGFVEGDIFQLLQAPTEIEGLRVVGIDSEGYRVYFLNRKAIDTWFGDPSMMKYFPKKGEIPTGGGAIAVFTRLVLVRENGELKEKRLVFSIRE